MIKKRWIFLFVVLFLIFMIYLEVPGKIIDAIRGNEPDEPNFDELPPAIANMLKQQSEYYLGLKLAEEEKRKQDILYLLSIIVETAAVFLIVALILLLFVNKKFIKRFKHRFRAIKRELRRRFFYRLIEKEKKKGNTFKEIKHILTKKGYDHLHVGDAIVRYKRRHLIK